MNYPQFFQQATNLETCYLYQERLATEPWPDFLEIPTGLGKTAAVMLAWLYKRTVLHDAQTPRRLVYCLPMRVLVEQTEDELKCWLARSGTNIDVHVLMGGEQDLQSWTLHPERDSIIIGTQDMLLSRALMRGYGMSRYQWPVQFALLHNDAFWVFDEVQLMGTGLTTSAQLEALRRRFHAHGNARSMWLSATLNRQWLHTVDFAEHLASARTQQLTTEEKRLPAVQQRYLAPKRLQQAIEELNADSKKGNYKSYLDALARQILAVHQTETNTLVVLNSVERAQGLLQRLQKHKPQAELLLIHARFRRAERRQLNQAIKKAPTEAGRIIVATQAIEAGVDISSRNLFTELAPWASLVQRFGRCNRAGECVEGADIFWLDITDEKSAPPYDYAELEQAREKLRDLTDAAPAHLPQVTAEQPIGHLLREKDFLDLFNTEADLTGFDTDISAHLRDEGAPQLQVFWRDFPIEKPEETQPGHAELCPVSISQIKAYLGKDKAKAWIWDYLGEAWKAVDQYRVYPGMTLLLHSANGGYDAQLGFIADGKTKVAPLPIQVFWRDFPIEKPEETQPDHAELCPVSMSQIKAYLGKDKTKAFVWDHFGDRWKAVDQYRVYPGMTLLLHVANGSYDAQLGFIADGKTKIVPLHKTDSSDNSYRGDPNSRQDKAIALKDHLAHVADAAQALLDTLALDESIKNAIVTAAAWHDVGKAHEVFQETMRKDTALNADQLWAKSTANARHSRRYFRHELASMLAWIEHGEESPQRDLIAYLIAAHHGKVRLSLRALPDEKPPKEPGKRYARGVHEGDRLPALSFGEQTLPETTLRLDLMELGESEAMGPSWTTRVQRLLAEHGPFRLAWYETLVRIADWRASEQEQQ